MKRLKFLALAVVVFSLTLAASCEPKGGNDKKKNCIDSDGDQVCDLYDGCPADILKTAPGQCGCDNPDTDGDNDGTADCVDGCLTDIAKIAPGQCGCGNPDTDGDHDGTANCLDLCPADPGKIAPGVCGCGVADIDSDTDGVLNCLDGCPSDHNKTVPGICGCGVADTDSDNDGVPNCQDGCDYDPAKTEPGLCGCNKIDDPTDSDDDGTADCIDGCDYNPVKIAPGVCGCSLDDGLDFTGDGVIDCGANYLYPYPIALPSGLIATVLAPAASWRNDTSIALDSQNNLHVLYRGMKISDLGWSYDAFIYANNIGSFWKGGSLGGTIGHFNSMVLDTNDKVHIAVNVGQYNERLSYITNKTGQWVTELVDGASSVGLENDILLDPQGKVHISYWQWNGAQAHYATNLSGQWEVTDSGFGGWYPAPILADSNNKIHLFWAWSESWVENNILLGREYFIYEYTNAIGSWATNTLWDKKCNCSIDVEMSAAIGNNGAVYFINSFGLLTSQGNILLEDAIFQQMGLSFVANDFNIDEDSLAIDSNNKLHFTFMVWEDHEQLKVYYVSNVLGIWKYKLLDQWPLESTDWESDVVFAPGLTLGADGNAYIIYVNTGDLTVRYVSFNPQTFLAAP